MILTSPTVMALSTPLVEVVVVVLAMVVPMVVPMVAPMVAPRRRNILVRRQCPWVILFRWGVGGGGGDVQNLRERPGLGRSWRRGKRKCWRA